MSEKEANQLKRWKSNEDEEKNKDSPPFHPILFADSPIRNSNRKKKEERRCSSDIPALKPRV
jgi:hypothetical protein